MTRPIWVDVLAPQPMTPAEVADLVARARAIEERNRWVVSARAGWTTHADARGSAGRRCSREVEPWE